MRIGDCIAAESRSDLKSDDSPPHGLSRRHRQLLSARREFPPPISWLAHTECLPWRMPWVMKRYSTSDGRLIITEERAERRDYFVADRSDGRLVLNLVHVDIEVEERCEESGDAEEEESVKLPCDGGDERTGGYSVAEVALELECYKYNGVAVKPCGGFVAAAAAAAAVFRPPVHT